MKTRAAHTWLIFAAANMAAATPACAPSSRAKYGVVAVYDRDWRAWVATGKDETFVLRNPVTGCVLRCRADAERFAAANAERSRVNNKNNSAMWRAGLMTAPLTAPAVLLGLPWGLVGAAVSEHPASDYRRRGDLAMKSGDSTNAAAAYTLAVATGDNLAAEPLAQALVAIGRLEEAKTARSMLICCGAKLGDAAWTTIETWLKLQGENPPSCEGASSEPVEVPWLE